MSWSADLTRSELAQIALIAALLAVSGGLWFRAVRSWLHGQFVIPLARRRPVPWLGRDVLLVFAIAWTLTLMAALAASAAAGRDVDKASSHDKFQTDHPAEQLLRTREPGKVALVALVAVIVAPAFEELLFRVLLQGWLEAVWTRRRRKDPVLRNPPASWFPLLLPAILFAMMHFRAGSPPQSPEFLLRGLIAQVAAETIAVCIAILLLRRIAGAEAADFGWQPLKLCFDAKLALWGLAGAVPPLLALHMDLTFAFQRFRVNLAPDPIPLFFLALMFGYLYRRTHRIAPSFIMHAAFNAISIGLFFLGS